MRKEGIESRLKCDVIHFFVVSRIFFLYFLLQLPHMYILYSSCKLCKNRLLAENIFCNLQKEERNISNPAGYWSHRESEFVH